jgi:hypothetical protein
VEVAGDQSPLPDHLNFGYRRREFIVAGDEVSKDQSTLARLDVESAWNDGLALRETFATGRAAERIAGDTTAPNSPGDNGSKIQQPLVFGSRTRIGLSFVMPGADESPAPSFLAGYSRRVATVVRSNGQKVLPSVAADMTIHSSGINPKGTAPTASLKPSAQLSDGMSNTPGNARIRQFFAVGKAADRVAKNPEQAKAIIEATTSGPLETTGESDQ